MLGCCKPVGGKNLQVQTEEKDQADTEDVVRDSIAKEGERHHGLGHA